LNTGDTPKASPLNGREAENLWWTKVDFRNQIKGAVNHAIQKVTKPPNYVTKSKSQRRSRTGKP